MQVAYTRDEMIDITELSKSLDSVIDKLKNNTIDKIAIIKDNKPEVVIITTCEYERIKTISDKISSND
jgi:PHD/YefM family antitoxin component YafN of YafNO toxin-antitoxin module